MFFIHKLNGACQSDRKPLWAKTPKKRCEQFSKVTSFLCSSQWRNDTEILLSLGIPLGSISMKNEAGKSPLDLRRHAPKVQPLCLGHLNFSTQIKFCLHCPPKVSF